MLASFFLAMVTFAFCDVPSSLTDALLSTKLTQRIVAMRIARARLIGLDRKNSIPFFKLIIATNPRVTPANLFRENYEVQLSPKRISLLIMAQWNDESLIDLFLDYIIYFTPDPLDPSSITSQDSCTDYAAVIGLINIGKASIQPCLRELAKDVEFKKTDEYNRYEDYPERLADVRSGNLTFVIWSLVGYRETIAIFNKEIDRISKRDPGGASNLIKARDKLAANAYSRTRLK